MVQGSDEWKMSRCGCVTASRVIDIVKGVKGKYTASRKNYMAEKVCEILTGEPTEYFTSGAMEWGTENEPYARAAYEGIKGVFVEEVGFINHPVISRFGASPDGLVNNDGSIEIKCPNTATHLDTLINGTIKRDYIYQMQTVMLCGNREWCDFVSYDPRLPEDLSTYIHRVMRDETIIMEIVDEVEKCI